MNTDAETLLQNTLARCADSVSQCLANAQTGLPYNRGNEMDRAVALMQACARVADALARLRGQHIHVTREGGRPKRGSNGQTHR